MSVVRGKKEDLLHLWGKKRNITKKGGGNETSNRGSMSLPRRKSVFLQTLKKEMEEE